MDREEYLEIVEDIRDAHKANDMESVLRFSRELDLSRIKEPPVMEMIADAYYALGDTPSARDLLLDAYDMTTIGRSIAYKLAEICIETGNIRDAVGYYTDFCKVSPKDNRKYVLKYDIAKAGGVEPEELIKILEEYTAVEFDEKYMYELAELYHSQGEDEKCAEACDNLTLWFSDGEYVDRALEMKKEVSELSLRQQSLYASMHADIPRMQEQSETHRPEEEAPEETFEEDDIPAGFDRLGISLEDDDDMVELTDSFDKTADDEETSDEETSFAEQEGEPLQSEDAAAVSEIDYEGSQMSFDDVFDGYLNKDEEPSKQSHVNFYDDEPEFEGYDFDTKEESEKAEALEEASETDETPAEEPAATEPPEATFKAASYVEPAAEYDKNYLSDEMCDEISEYLMIEGMEDKLIGTITDIVRKKYSGRANGGNLIVTGESKSGKTYLTLAILKEVRRKTGVGTGRVAKVQAEALNGKNIAAVLNKISGSDLLIENVGLLEDETINALLSAVKSGKYDSMISIEDNILAINSIISKFPEVEELFANRIDIHELNMSQWAEVACDYANERGYSIGDIALLALHKKIDENNVANARFGMDDVIDIVEDAIYAAEERGAGKHRRKRKELIELAESDFI